MLEPRGPAAQAGSPGQRASEQVERRLNRFHPGAVALLVVHVRDVGEQNWQRGAQAGEVVLGTGTRLVPGARQDLAPPDQLPPEATSPWPCRETEIPKPWLDIRINQLICIEKTGSPVHAAQN